MYTMYPRIHPLRGGGEDGDGILYTYSVLLPTLCIYMHMKKSMTCYISGMHVMYLGTSINTSTNSSMQCISSVVVYIPMYSTMYPYHPLIHGMRGWWWYPVYLLCIYMQTENGSWYRSVSGWSRYEMSSLETGL